MGVPEWWWDHSYSIPWMDLMDQKINEILTRDSDINSYGATNRQEFFAVASEYFFERPHLLERKHPDLYKVLVQIFKQDPQERLPAKVQKRKTISRQPIHVPATAVKSLNIVA